MQFKDVVPSPSLFFSRSCRPSWAPVPVSHVIPFSNADIIHMYSRRNKVAIDLLALLLTMSLWIVVCCYCGWISRVLREVNVQPLPFWATVSETCQTLFLLFPLVQHMCYCRCNSTMARSNGLVVVESLLFRSCASLKSH